MSGLSARLSWEATSGGEPHGWVWPVGVDVPVRAGPLEYTRFGLSHLPPSVVLEGVVASAEMGEVISTGGTAVFCRNRVIDVATTRWTGAAGESTSAIPDAKEPAQLL